MSDKFFSQLRVACSARLFNFFDFIRNVCCYYTNLSFAVLDLSVLMSYFWKSPYSIARQAGLPPYGETPFATLETLAKRAHITEKDIVYDLGSGRGRGCFWLATFLHCTVHGVEKNDIFIEKARQIKRRFHMQYVHFLHEDIFQVDLKSATVIYFFGTLFNEVAIKKLCERFSKLRSGTRIITISYSLDEYMPSSFILVDTCSVYFPWGKTTAYIQRVP